MRKTGNANVRADEDLVICDICEQEKSRKEFHTCNVNICNECVEINHCMSIQ